MNWPRETGADGISSSRPPRFVGKLGKCGFARLEVERRRDLLGIRGVKEAGRLAFAPGSKAIGSRPSSQG